MNVKRLSECKDFEGTDVNLSISLFEYGLICKKNEKGEIQCWFGVDYGINGNWNSFDSGWISEERIQEIINEEWFNKPSFFAYLGTTETEWLTAKNVNKISDLLSYYGYENIFGTCYSSVKFIDD